MTDTQNMSYYGADNAQIDRSIEGAYPDAWRRCIKVMPRMWFANESFIAQNQIKDIPNGTGYVILPEDFYLLSSFRLSSWKKSVHEASLENERTSSIQSNEYTRGSEIRPVCTISIKETETGIKNILNYYSVKKGFPQTITEAIYVPTVKPLSTLGADEDLKLNDQILEPLAYITASTVFTVLEKYDIAKALDQRAVEMFPGLQSVKGNIITTKQ